MNTMFSSEKDYLPAAGYDWLLPFYDPIVKLLGADRARRALLDGISVQSGRRILDIGCGTGTFVILIKKLHPDVNVIGLDPDPKALARAQRKAERAAMSVRFDQGSSNKLPYPEGSFDRVFSTFMLHHLHPDEKDKTICEVHRVLAPGGSFHLLDFAPPSTNSHGFLTRHFHSSERLKDNTVQRILSLMTKAGFASCEVVRERTIVLGVFPIVYYQGKKF
jgi:ubiquinone/menaquinone biosynthesis C-methylase UbiE